MSVVAPLWSDDHNEGSIMRIAGSIILGVVGAILYFAVDVDVAGVNLPMIGVILMVAAAIWFVIELIIGVTGDRVSSTEVVHNPDGTVQQRETRTRAQRPGDERL